jgi:polysaccharide biosynthesis protein PelD
MLELLDRLSSSARLRGQQDWFRCSEILGLTAGVPLLALGMQAQDPFFVRAVFPWLILVPLLIAVQHGLGSAVVSAALLSSGAWVYEAVVGARTPGFWVWTAGCFLVALVAGWFKDQALSREQELGTRVHELDARLQRLVRSHQVLELSHSRLEEHLVAEGWSLESVVKHASEELARAVTPARVYGVVLDVLASQAQLLAATFFALAPRGSGHAEEAASLEVTPAASLGKPFRAQALAPASGRGVVGHPIVQRALLTRQVALLAPERGAEPVDEIVLAAVPLVASGDRLLGVLAVHEMPFICFTPGTFAELETIARSLADLADARLRELSIGSVKPELVRRRSGLRFRLTGGTEPSAPDSDAPRVGGKRG